MAPAHLPVSVVRFVYDAIMAAPDEKRNDFFGCILLVGGGAVNGLVTRFTTEMQLLQLSSNVFATSNPAVTVAEGATQFSLSPQYLERTITREDYLSSLEEAPDCVFKKSSNIETTVLSSLNAKFQRMFKQEK